MKLIAAKKQMLFATLLIFFLWSFPNGFAEANSGDMIFDCFESEEGCEENETPIDDEESSDAAKGLSAKDYIRALFALVFVVGLLFGLLKFMNSRNRAYDKNRLMKNMGGISLGQHKSIQLVVIGDTHYLIGVGDDVRLLKEITDPEELEKLRSFYKESQVESTKGLLEQLLMKFTKKDKANPYQSEENTDFSQLLNSRLDEMKEERNRQISRLTEKERNKDE